MTDSLRRSYRSFSGVDIKATFNGVHVGKLQGVSFTITREKAPQYVMGKVDPISFSRGKRGIAGSLIFLVFDKTNLVQEMGNLRFYADRADVRRGGSRGGSELRDAETVRSALATEVEGVSDVASQYDLEKAIPWYHDQIPPFDIVLTALTEYGQISKMIIHNVEILNSGSGISIDDITTDENMTFVATDITPWYSIQPGAPVDGSAFNDYATFQPGQANFLP